MCSDTHSVEQNVEDVKRMKDKVCEVAVFSTLSHIHHASLPSFSRINLAPLPASP